MERSSDVDSVLQHLPSTSFRGAGIFRPIPTTHNSESTKGCPLCFPQTNIVRLITSSSLHCQVTASAKYICRLRCMNRRRVALSAPYGHLRSMVFRLSAYGCRYHDCDLPTRVLPCMGRWWRGKDLHLLLRKQVDVLVHR